MLKWYFQHYFCAMSASLSEIRNYIRAYYRSAFHTIYFAAIILLLSLTLLINYGYMVDFSANFFLTYLVYFFPFLIAYLLQWFYFPKQRKPFSGKMFWFLLLVAPAIFAAKLHFNWHLPLLKPLLSTDKLKYSLAVINYVVKFFVVFIPVTVIWSYLDKGKQPLYGFTPSKNISVYYWLLAAMLPLVIIAAAMPDFAGTYPKAFTNAALMDSQNISSYLLFELAYALDFFTVEFFFRGFLIIAFCRYFGMNVILPAACFYCCIHLGKPMPEAISSFFGGLLLGIISYHTQSIWGGLLIHIGIAWMMEVAAYISRQF